MTTRTVPKPAAAGARPVVRVLAGAGDAARYRALRLECLERFPDNFGSSHDEESRKPRLAFEEFIEAGAADRFMFGAFMGERLVGIAGFIREGRRKARHRGEVVQMYVDPAFRGQRVGERLLSALIDAAFALEGVEQLELGVVSVNSSAKALYERLGFAVHGEIGNYFRDGTRTWNQLLMHLSRQKWVKR